MISGFFDSNITDYDEEGMPVFDHAVDSAFFARYFASILKNGVFMTNSNALQIMAATGMNIQINAGMCLINGYFGWQEEPQTMAIAPSPDGNRITAIMARLDLAAGKIDYYVADGTPAQTPVSPSVTRPMDGEGGDIYDLCLGRVRVNRNVSQITQADITDTRLDTTVCGIVTGLIDQVDTTTLYNRIQTDLANFRNVTQAEYNTWTSEKKAAYDSWVAAKQAEYNTWTADKKSAYDAWVATSKSDYDEYIGATQAAYDTWTTEKKAAYDTWVQGRDAAFMAWWNTIKATMGEDAAGNLLNLINNHTADHNNPHHVDKADVGLPDVPNVVPYHAGNKPTKADVGLGNVDNTADSAKPVSTATQAALDGKLDKTGGTVTGNLILNGDVTNETGTITLGKKEYSPDFGPWWGAKLNIKSSTIDVDSKYINMYAGMGIKFNSSANFLSGIQKNGKDIPDMEVGTWTPEMLSGITISSDYGQSDYIRIGKLVFLYTRLRGKYNSTAAGFEVSGLPFAPHKIYVPAFNARFVFSTPNEQTRVNYKNEYDPATMWTQIKGQSVWFLMAIKGGVAEYNLAPSCLELTSGTFSMQLRGSYIIA